LDDFRRRTHDLRGGGFLHDHVRYRDNLLFGGFEVAGLLGHGAKFLDRVHHLFGLINESCAEINAPWQIGIHFGDHFREPRDGFDIVVPRLRIQLGNVVRVLHEPCGLDDFKRISCCGQNDGNERIRMERDRLDELFQLCGALFGGRRRRWRGTRRRGRKCR